MNSEEFDTSAPISYCPRALFKAGVTTTRQAEVLIHLGRCGTNGATTAQIAETLGHGSRTADNILRELRACNLVLSYTILNRTGRPHLWVVSPAGWQAITTRADLRRFPDGTEAVRTMKLEKTPDPAP